MKYNKNTIFYLTKIKKKIIYKNIIIFGSNRESDEILQ